MTRTQTGFTLIELLIVVAIVGILLAVAVPGYRSAVAAVHSETTRAALAASVMTASERAIMSGGRVVMCPSADGQTCRAGFDWSAGWIVFHDLDGNRERAANEAIIVQQLALENGLRLLSSKGRTRIVFQSDGGNAGSNVTFTLCGSRGVAKASALVLSNLGRMRLTDVDDSHAALACAG